MPNENGSFAEKVAFVTGAAAEDAQRIRIRMGDQTVPQRSIAARPLGTSSRCFLCPSACVTI